MELSGPGAFYNHERYGVVTRHELGASTLPEPIYSYETSPKWERLGIDVVFHGSSLILVYTIASFCINKISKNYLNPPSLPKVVVWVTTPFALFNTVHVLVGIIAHIAITRKTNDARRLSFLDGEREVKRVCIEANGYPIDALIVGRKSRIDNGRWVIYSNGNGEHYEDRREDYLTLADRLNANILYYNYTGVGRSGGVFSNHDANIAAHQAMHAFAYEELGARFIADIGHSIGGGIQGTSLETMTLKEDVEYLFVKHMSFSTLADVASGIVGKPAGYTIPWINWNYYSVESSKALSCREIIIQQGNVNQTQVMTDVNQLKENDGVIPKAQSLGKVLFEDPDCPRIKKTFIVTPEGHNDLMSEGVMTAITA